MSDSSKNTAFESDLDLLFQNCIPKLPPEDIVASVTPWKKAMNRVLLGLALNAITLNFTGLNYILPAIGMLFMLLGFRALHRENKWVSVCYVITVIRAAYFFPLLILNTTIYQSVVYSSDWIYLLTAVNLILQFVQYFCLWRGLIEIKQKVKLESSASSAAWMMVWYVMICVLGLIRYSGWLIFIGMIVIYICIIISLRQLSKDLDEAGYAIEPAPVSLSDRVLSLLIGLLLLIGAVCGYMFGSSYKMDWTVLDSAEHSEVQNIKAHLMELGFPEYVLNDLSVQDILACRGATQVLCDVVDHPVNDGRQVTTKTPGEAASGIDWHYEITTVFDTKELRMTGVGVRLPTERESWLIFHHFLWTENPGFFGTECIQLWPAYRLSQGWGSAGEVSGRLLYDRDNTTYVSPYHSLGSETYTQNTVIWGNQTNTDIFATFSLPQKGENHRGYLAYPIVELQDGWITDCWINYLHHRNAMEYPAYTAVQRRKAGSWSQGKKYKLVQDALQFYSKGSDANLLSAE